MAIAVLGFLVWGHHMFVSSQSIYAGMVFSFLSFLVAIPSAIKVFNWTATLYKGSISFETPMLYALGFIGLFTIGGLTGLFLAALGRRCPCARHLFRHRAFPLHHGRRNGDGVSWADCIFGGRKLPAGCIRNSGAACGDRRSFVGFNLTFFPQFVARLSGHAAALSRLPAGVSDLNVLSTAGASILGVGYLLPLIYLIWSLHTGRAAGPNPWRATGSEWQTPRRRQNITSKRCRSSRTSRMLTQPKRSVICTWRMHDGRARRPVAPTNGVKRA